MRIIAKETIINSKHGCIVIAVFSFYCSFLVCSLSSFASGKMQCDSQLYYKSTGRESNHIVPFLIDPRITRSSRLRCVRVELFLCFARVILLSPLLWDSVICCQIYLFLIGQTFVWWWQPLFAEKKNIYSYFYVY